MFPAVASPWAWDMVLVAMNMSGMLGCKAPDVGHESWCQRETVSASELLVLHLVDEMRHGLTVWSSLAYHVHVTKCSYVG